MPVSAIMKLITWNGMTFGCDCPPPVLLMAVASAVTAGAGAWVVYAAPEVAAAQLFPAGVPDVPGSVVQLRVWL